jgi:hypothetical protein
LYCSTNAVNIKQLEEGEMRRDCRIQQRDVKYINTFSQEIRPHGRPRHRWWNNIKINSLDR